MGNKVNQKVMKVKNKLKNKGTKMRKSKMRTFKMNKNLNLTFETVIM